MVLSFLFVFFYVSVFFAFVFFCLSFLDWELRYDVFSCYVYELLCFFRNLCLVFLLYCFNSFSGIFSLLTYFCGMSNIVFYYNYCFFFLLFLVSFFFALVMDFDFFFYFFLILIFVCLLGF